MPERVGPVPLGRRGQQADPVEGLRRLALEQCAGRVVRSAASSRAQVGAAGQVGVEGRALDQGAHPGEDVAGPGRHRLPQQLRRVPCVGATSPSSIRMVVVLPEPFGPRKP